MRFLTYCAFLLNQMSYIRDIWKYWPLKDGFWSILQGCYFVLGGPKNIKPSADIFIREQPSKYYMVECTAVFVCLLISWSRRNSMKWSTSAVRNFNNSWPRHLKYDACDKPLPKYLIHQKFQMSTIFFWKRNRQKNHKFFIFVKGRYFVMGGPIDMILAIFERLLWVF